MTEWTVSSTEGLESLWNGYTEMFLSEIAKGCQMGGGGVRCNSKVEKKPNRNTDDNKKQWAIKMIKVQGRIHELETEEWHTELTKGWSSLKLTWLYPSTHQANQSKEMIVGNSETYVPKTSEKFRRNRYIYKYLWHTENKTRNINTLNRPITLRRLKQ